jgi:hypothetical protein
VVHFRQHQLKVKGADRDGTASLFFRPHDTEIVTDGPSLPAIVSLSRPRGGGTRLEADVEGLEVPIEIDFAGANPPNVGDTISVAPTESRLFYD